MKRGILIVLGALSALFLQGCRDSCVVYGRRVCGLTLRSTRFIRSWKACTTRHSSSATQLPSGAAHRLRGLWSSGPSSSSASALSIRRCVRPLQEQRETLAARRAGLSLRASLRRSPGERGPKIPSLPPSRARAPVRPPPRDSTRPRRWAARGVPAPGLRWYLPETS